jgi:hypothetical protein
MRDDLNDLVTREEMELIAADKGMTVDEYARWFCQQREGEHAVLTQHCAVFGDLTQTVRKFKVDEVRNTYGVRSVSIYCVEPRKRNGEMYTMSSNTSRYITISVNGAVVYDSRDDVPCDMDQWRATRARFPRGAGLIRHE